MNNSGTATQVAYFSSTNVVSSDSNLYWDNTNKRLGIGTTTPTQALTIGLTGAAYMDFSAAAGATVYARFGGYSDGATAGHLEFYTLNNGTITEQMRLTSAGYFAIGATNPTYPLYVGTSATNTSIYAIGDIAAFSDESVKTDVQVIDNALEKVKQIRGVTFIRTDIGSGDRKAGVIAQEVEKVLPEVITVHPDGTKAVSYGNMNGLLIQAIKEQQLMIEKLVTRVTELEMMIGSSQS